MLLSQEIGLDDVDELTGVGAQRRTQPAATGQDEAVDFEAARLVGQAPIHKHPGCGLAPTVQHEGLSLVDEVEHRPQAEHVRLGTRYVLPGDERRRIQARLPLVIEFGKLRQLLETDGIPQLAVVTLEQLALHEARRVGLEETIDDLLLTLLMGLALEHDDAANVERAMLAMPDDLVFLNQGEQRQLGDFLVVEDTDADVAVLRRLDATEDGERTEVVNTLDVVHQVRELVRCHLRRLGEQKGGAEPAQLHGQPIGTYTSVRGPTIAMLGLD